MHIMYYFAVPVTEVVSLSVTVATDLGDDEVTCLLEGHDVDLTCIVEGGYPRPEIIFKKGSKTVVPGEDQFFRISKTYSDQVLDV